MTEQINKIFEYHRLALEKTKQYPKKRDIFERIQTQSGKHFTGIIGPRGAGKSILLRQITATKENAIYISLDALGKFPLFETIKELNQTHNITHFHLDEIHFIKNADEELKKIYDFLDIKLIFTSSVALAMKQSAFDLARRVHLIEISSFSYKEYLYFKKEIILPNLSLEGIIAAEGIHEHLKYGADFESYLKGGNMPFSLEETNIFPLLENILDKLLIKDIPKIHPILVEEIEIIKKMIKFIAKSDVDGISYSAISHNLKITKYKAEKYTTLLRDAFILQTIFPAGTNVMKEAKIILRPPYRLLYKSYDEAIGALREEFAAESLSKTAYSLNYLKSTRGKKTPDYLTEINGRKVVLEVGGKTKGRTQFKGVKADQKVILTHSTQVDEQRRPLFLLGFLGENWHHDHA